MAPSSAPAAAPAPAPAPAPVEGGARCAERYNGGPTSELTLSLELLDFTDGLSTALTVEEVTQVASRTMLLRLGVTFTGMVLFEDDGDVSAGGRSADGPSGPAEGRNTADGPGVRTRVLAWPRPPIVDRVWAGPGGYGPAAAVQVMRTGQARFDESKERYLADFPDRAEIFTALGIDACVSLPIVVDGRALGVLLLAWPEPKPFSAGCRSFLLAIAAAYGRAVERARSYERQMCMVETLQRAILPQQLPVVDGVQLAARYLPTGRDVGIGGDWYDATVLPDGTLALAVGDVGGHGLRATALMAELSHSARAYALHGLSPAAITTQLSANLAGSGGEILATAVIGHLNPADGRFSWSCAGHPPPLHLAAPGGQPRYLAEVHGPMLGVLPDHQYGQSGIRLTGHGLLLYTDGLVERRGESISRRLDALAAATAARLPAARGPAPTTPHAARPVRPTLPATPAGELAAVLRDGLASPLPGPSVLDDLCDALLTEIAGPTEREDDVCMLGVALT
ncbi:PP2C family protein-serine/threonine phosphatase [Frankia sp. EI5c]|uniref:PP2C family protein-serine/threonine phosphatase n=1 Tax=Frankia sp. EI5c TaxID=683316 RepID=UPI001F5B0A55|nr:GAF domain-containing SpoIIE family protein phosphatase [Frankia sp. EI5c]